MFDTVRHRPSERNVGRSVKLVLTGAAVFTLLAGGTALATTATSSGNDTHQVPAAQLLHAGDSGITEVESPDSDAADDAAEAAREAAKEAAEAAKEAADEAADPDGADGAQGAHGACVSKVAHDKVNEGFLNHGAAVSEAAHNCAKGPDAAAGAAKGAEKSAAAQAKRAAKAAARAARGKG